MCEGRPSHLQREDAEFHLVSLHPDKFVFHAASAGTEGPGGAFYRVCRDGTRGERFPLE